MLFDAMLHDKYYLVLIVLILNEVLYDNIFIFMWFLLTNAMLLSLTQLFTRSLPVTSQPLTLHYIFDIV